MRMINEKTKHNEKPSFAVSFYLHPLSSISLSCQHFLTSFLLPVTLYLSYTSPTFVFLAHFDTFDLSCYFPTKMFFPPLPSLFFTFRFPINFLSSSNSPIFCYSVPHSLPTPLSSRPLMRPPSSAFVPLFFAAVGDVSVFPVSAFRY